MLTVLSQPLLRQRHAVQVVTPTCSSHRERLTTAAPGSGYDLPFDSIFTRHNLLRIRRALERIKKSGDDFPALRQQLDLLLAFFIEQILVGGFDDFYQIGGFEQAGNRDIAGSG